MLATNNNLTTYCVLVEIVTQKYVQGTRYKVQGMYVLYVIYMFQLQSFKVRKK